MVEKSIINFAKDSYGGVKIDDMDILANTEELF